MTEVSEEAMEFEAKTTDATAYRRPVLYCDENFIIVDMNDAADERGFLRYRYKSMKDYLPDGDLANLTEGMHLKKSAVGDKDPHRIVQIVHMRSAGYAFVTIQNLGDTYYFRFHIFQSRADIFRDFEVAKMMLSELPFSPIYTLNRSRPAMEMTAENINRVLASNFLINVYFTAADSKEAPQKIDVVETVRRMILDVSKRLELNLSDFEFTFEEKAPFAYPVIGVSNFINVLSLLIILTGRISETKKVSVRVDSDRERASILFRTTLKKSDIDFLGGFSFDHLGAMFPKYAVYVSIVNFICELYGLRCYAALEGKRKLTVELVLAEAPPDVEIHCMHNTADGELDEMISDSSLFAAMIDKAEDPEEGKQNGN